MIRNIISIDRDKCDGCGLCAKACHEGAIVIENGKAKLIREDYCDGLGDCLPACPQNAITMEKREAPDYNEAAVLAAKNKSLAKPPLESNSRLQNFPIQIKLAPPNAPYFNGADLLIAADCTAYAYAGFHDAFMADKITLIGCPKLDGVNYAEKLTQILKENPVNSITVVRMTVPCCGGLPFAVKTALEVTGKDLPLNIVTISPDGRIVS